MMLLQVLLKRSWIENSYPKLIHPKCFAHGLNRAVKTGKDRLVGKDRQCKQSIYEDS